MGTPRGVEDANVDVGGPLTEPRSREILSQLVPTVGSH
jgi:hypothetical protein